MVECLFTRCSRLFNRLDNRLYRVNGVLRYSAFRFIPLGFYFFPVIFIMNCMQCTDESVFARSVSKTGRPFCSTGQMQLVCIRVLSWCVRRRERLQRHDVESGQQASAHRLHQAPDSRAREGVSLQPLPDAAPAHRDRAHALPHRATDQDLVPEPAHEGQKGEDADHGAERARKVGVVMATAAASAATTLRGDARSTARLHRRGCRQRGRSLTWFSYILALLLRPRVRKRIRTDSKRRAYEFQIV